MKRQTLLHIIAYLMFFCCRDLPAQNLRENITSRDSLNSSVNILKELEEIKTENKILKEKVEVLNSTNDKILNSVYWTIGAILTSIFGLTVWNGIKNRNLDEEKFKVVLEKSKNELDDSLGKKLKESIKNASFSELSSVKSDIYKLKNQVEDFKIFYITGELKYHPFWNIRDDGYLFHHYFNFVITNKITSEYKQLLETAIDYLKGKPYMSLDDRNKILNFIDSECSNQQYNIYVDKLKQSIELLK